MKVPFSWLGEYFSETLDPHEVADRLTLSGIEVDLVQTVGVFDALVVVAEITAIEPLTKNPGARRISVLADRARNVISNASHLLVGQKLAVALPGATLLGAPGFSLLQVEESELYGERSEAVLVHAANLGVGSDAESPMVFDATAKNGQPVAALLALPADLTADRVLHLAILPNIARCQSMVGVAREVAGLLRKGFVGRVVPVGEEAPQHLNPTLKAADACSVLGVTLLENVQVGASPAWLQRRLVLAGMTPINNVVDASNYVMLELGQPTHPYDADRLPDLELGVRRSLRGERLLTLQQAETDQPVELPEGVPVIVSNDTPVAIAGVLGGRLTSIHEGTTRVLLEAAAFDYVAIRRSQQATKFYSEASARFSRGVNPELPGVAARRFVEVLRESSPELRVAAAGEASLGVPPERRIELSLLELNASLGTDFCLDETVASLQLAGFEIEVEPSGERLVVTVGNARADITLPCDLIEEVARLQGYDRIPESVSAEPVPERLHDDRSQTREALRDVLVRVGLQEIISYSLSGAELEARVYSGHPAAPRRTPIPLRNPVSAERSVLRTSLVPALLQTAAQNLRHSGVCRLFELGHVFSPDEALKPLPAERERAVIVLAGAASPATLHEKAPRPSDFFDIKAIVVELLSSLGLNDGVEFTALDAPPYRPGAAASVVRRGCEYGTLGAVHPRVLAAFDSEQPAFVADLDVAALLRDAPARPSFADYERLPSIELDIALVVDLEVTAARIREVVRAVGGPFLREVEVFDEFRAAQFGANKKSLAIRLRLNAGERTLQISEASEVRARAAQALTRELGAQIRE